MLLGVAPACFCLHRNKVGALGTVLEPGHLMLSGSFTRPVWANPGDTLHADFGALGGVSVQFV